MEQVLADHDPDEACTFGGPRLYHKQKCASHRNHQSATLAASAH